MEKCRKCESENIREEKHMGGKSYRCLDCDYMEVINNENAQ